MNYCLISSAEDLENFLTMAVNAGTIALDTEFTRTRTYYPMLSTIQVCLPSGEIFILDVLDGPDISAMESLISTSDVKKIIHACRQDIEALYYYFKCIPSNIVDTQILAKTCGLGIQCSYASLARHFTGIDIDKTCQRSQWHKRPLNLKQLHYMCDDVRFLYTIYNSLLKMLPDGILAEKEFNPDFHIFAEEPKQQFDVQKFCRRHIGRLDNESSRETATKLLLLREEAAMQHNIARRFVMRDADVIAIARHRPSSVTRLRTMCRLHHLLDLRRIIAIVNGDQ